MTHAIDVRNLHKAFGDLEVLQGIDFTVETGEVVCVLGPSGSGKSTLLRCLNRLEEPNGGQILIDGEDITDPDADVDQLRTNIGMVFQQFNLFGHLTAKENVAGPLRWVHGMGRFEAERRALELLERVGLSHRADALPFCAALPRGPSHGAPLQRDAARGEATRTPLGQLLASFFY